MKKTVFLLLVFLSFIARSQALPRQIDVQMKIQDKHSAKMLVPQYTGNGEQYIEGYLFNTEYNSFPEAIFQKGGFNFLNENVFGGIVSTLSHRWVKNGFVPGSVEMLTSGMDVKTALSFTINPQQLNTNGDSLYFLLKIARYDLKKKNGDQIDRDYQVRLFYFLTGVPLNKEVALPEINDCFPGQDITFSFSETSIPAERLIDSNPPEFTELIKKSISGSDSNKVTLDLDVQFFSCDNFVPELYSSPFGEDFFMKIKKNLTPESSIKASLFPDLKSRPPGSLYLAHLQFPFRIYDKADSLKYEGYKSKEKVFRQNYNVILIPQAITGDTVTVDMFLSYKKLDGVPMQRWTPIKKRFKICKNIPVRIDLPKENWCVSALLYGEKYDIYGYSHYERFVYEYLTLTLHSIFHEGN